MLRHEFSWLSTPLTLFLLLIGLSSVSFGQLAACADNNGDRAAIQSIIAEVRQLRMVIEKTAPVISRMHLALTRFQRQEDKVERLSREFQEFRNQETNIL